MPGQNVENIDKIKEAYKAAFGDLLPEWEAHLEESDAIVAEISKLNEKMKVTKQDIEREAWKKKFTGGKRWL